MVYESILELIGNTPLVHLNKIEEEYKLTCSIYGKLERQNPAGSIKDRAAYQMLKDYKEKGLLKPGATIIEPTSGNTGIALCALGSYFDYRIIIVMPKSMSIQRQQLMKAYNGELILVEGGMKEAVQKAEELKAQIPGSLILGQFDNPSNPKAHYLTTGKEILNDIEDVDYIFAGIGTGGTISGIGQFFKENHPSTKIIGIEPFSSPLITLGKTGPHKIQGIGANFIPDNYEKQYIDQVITVKDEDAILTAKMICKKEGLLVGISSGASTYGAISYIKQNHLENKKVVVILHDTGERYSWN